MTPTPEQIEKMAEEYRKVTTAYWTEERISGLEIETIDFVGIECRGYERGLEAGAHAMQSLMDAQAAKVQELVEALQKSISLLNCNYDYHAKTLIEEALTKWRSP